MRLVFLQQRRPQGPWQNAGMAGVISCHRTAYGPGGQPRLSTKVVHRFRAAVPALARARCRESRSPVLCRPHARLGDRGLVGTRTRLGGEAWGARSHEPDAQPRARPPAGKQNGLYVVDVGDGGTSARRVCSIAAPSTARGAKPRRRQGRATASSPVRSEPSIVVQRAGISPHHAPHGFEVVC